MSKAIIEVSGALMDKPFDEVLSFIKLKGLDVKLIKGDEYNGWSNRESWAMALHLDNKEEWYDDVVAIANNDLLKDFKRAEVIMEFVEELVYSLEENVNTSQQSGSWKNDVWNMISDVGSFWRIDWKEVLEHYKEEEK